MEKFISTPIASGLFSKAGYVASADQIVFKDDNGNITQTLPEAIDQLASNIPVAAQYAVRDAVQKQYNENEHLTLNWYGGFDINSRYSGLGIECKFQMDPPTKILLEYVKQENRANKRNITISESGIDINYFQSGSSNTLHVGQYGLLYNLYKVLTEEDYTVTINGVLYKRYDNITLDGSGNPINLSSYYTKDEVNNYFLAKLPNNTVFLNQSDFNRIGEVIDLQGLDPSISADYVYVNNIRKLNLQTNDTISVDSAISVNQDLSVSGVLYALNIESPDYNIANVTTGSSSEGDYINIGDASASGIKLYSTEDVKVIDDEDSVSHVITENNYHNYLNFDTIRGLSSTVNDSTLDSSLKSAIASFIKRSLSNDKSFNVTEGIVKSNGGYVIKMARFAPVDSNNNVHVIVEGNISIAGGMFSTSTSFEIYDVTYTKSNNTWVFSNYSRASLSWV